MDPAPREAVRGPSWRHPVLLLDLGSARSQAPAGAGRGGPCGVTGTINGTPCGVGSFLLHPRHTCPGVSARTQTELCVTGRLVGLSAGQVRSRARTGGLLTAMGSSLEPAGAPGRRWRSLFSLFSGKRGCVTARVLRTRRGLGVHPSSRSLRALGAVETKAITRSRCRQTPQLLSTPTARRAAGSLREPLPCRLRLAADAVLSVRDFSLDDAPSSPTDSSLRHYPVPAVISQQRTQAPPVQEWRLRPGASVWPQPDLPLRGGRLSSSRSEGAFVGRTRRESPGKWHVCLERSFPHPVRN